MTVSFWETMKNHTLEEFKTKEETKMEFEEINPDIWKPENEGDFVEGEYVKKDVEKGVNNSNAYYLQKDGQQMMVWGTTILDDRMGFAKVGDYIRIEYKGTQPNKKGQNVKLYKVLKARQATIET